MAGIESRESDVSGQKDEAVGKPKVVQVRCSTLGIATSAVSGLASEEPLTCPMESFPYRQST